MIAKYITKEIIKWNIPIILKILINIMVIKRNKKQKTYWKFSFYENIEWLKDLNIENDAFDFNKRKNWISLFARLKNSSDFLIESIESHIDLVDEIILVDNNSLDNTKEICKKMQEKYPQKIKYYDYKPQVYTYWHEKWSEIPNNSAFSMAYYYNWTLSKTTYKYVAKLDDDMIAFNHKLLKSRFDYIRKNWLNHLEVFPQFNIVSFDKVLKIPLQWTSKILPLFWWLYLDHWVFPISEKTYFVRDKTCETFLFSFWIKINPASIFHLKWMKVEAGTKQYLWDIRKKAFNLMTNWEFIDLPIKLKSELSKWVNIKDYK